MIWLWVVLLLPVCTPNEQGAIVCPRDNPPRQIITAPEWIIAAMESGEACSIGVDIYSTAPGEEAWYSWRENNPDAHIVERVQSSEAGVPDSWLFYASGQWVVFVFERRLSTVREGGMVVVHGECVRLIDG